MSTTARILTIRQIRHLLQDRRLEAVAYATGLHYNTVLYIRDTDQRNVGYKTLEKLSAYFERDHVADDFPKCYLSSPSVQQQIENDCFACKHKDYCLKKGVI